MAAWANQVFTCLVRHHGLEQGSSAWWQACTQAVVSGARVHRPFGEVMVLVMGGVGASRAFMRRLLARVGTEVRDFGGQASVLSYLRFRRALAGQAVQVAGTSVVWASEP